MNELQHVGAFVIQFRTGSDLGAGQAAGRIEHIASGRSAQFDSPGRLLELLARFLSDAQRTNPAASMNASQQTTPKRRT